MIRPETDDMSRYLMETEIIDYRSRPVQAAINNLKTPGLSEAQFMKKVYEYVRDRFPHSLDFFESCISKTHAPLAALQAAISCSASDVIRNGHGICYAKSHLLAAVLRGAGIPAGFCYQMLSFSEEDPKIIVHAVNAVYLSTLKKWIRLDARGNTNGVNAQFSLGEERLAFPVRPELGEKDGMIIYAEPSPSVVTVLKKSKTLSELMDNLPYSI